MPRTTSIPPAVASLLVLLLAAPAALAQSTPPPPSDPPESAPASSVTSVPDAERLATEQLRQERAGDRVETLTGPESPVTMQDPGVGVTGGDWAAETVPPAPANGRRAAGTGPRETPGADIAGDPVAGPPLPDVPEAIGEEMKDQGISGIDAPLPRSAETGRADAGSPSGGRPSGASAGQDGG